MTLLTIGFSFLFGTVAQLGATISPIQDIRSYPEKFMGKKIIACGSAIVSEDANIVLYDNGPYGRVGVLLGKEIIPSLKNSRICVTGTFGRIDGKSFEDASKDGVLVIADAAWDRNYRID